MDLEQFLSTQSYLQPLHQPPDGTHSPPPPLPSSSSSPPSSSSSSPSCILCQSKHTKANTVHTSRSPAKPIIITNMHCCFRPHKADILHFSISPCSSLPTTTHHKTQQQQQQQQIQVIKVKLGILLSKKEHDKKDNRTRMILQFDQVDDQCYRVLGRGIKHVEITKKGLIIHSGFLQWLLWLDNNNNNTNNSNDDDPSNKDITDCDDDGASHMDIGKIGNVLREIKNETYYFPFILESDKSYQDCIFHKNKDNYNKDVENYGVSDVYEELKKVCKNRCRLSTLCWRYTFPSLYPYFSEVGSTPLTMKPEGRVENDIAKSYVKCMKGCRNFVGKYSGKFDKEWEKELLEIENLLNETKEMSEEEKKLYGNKEKWMEMMRNGMGKELDFRGLIEYLALIKCFGPEIDDESLLVKSHKKNQQLKQSK